MNETDFLSAKLHTRWLDELLMAAPPQALSGDATKAVPSAEDAAVLAAVLYHISGNGEAGAAEKSAAPESRWKISGREELLNREPQR